MVTQYELRTRTREQAVRSSIPQVQPKETIVEVPSDNSAQIEAEKQQILAEAKAAVEKNKSEWADRLANLELTKAAIEEGGISGQESKDYTSTKKQIILAQQILGQYNKALSGSEEDLINADVNANKIYQRFKEKVSTRIAPDSTTAQISQLAKDNPNLSAGELLDVARKLNIVEAPKTGTKPQLEFSKDKSGNLFYNKVQEPEVVKTKEEKPFLTLTPALNFKQRFQQSIKDNKVQGTLKFIGSEIMRPIDRFSSYNIRNTKGYSNVFSGEQGKIISQAAPTGLYFVPGVGEGLMIAGGAEKTIKATTIKEGLLGLGEFALGSVSGVSKVKALEKSAAIKNADTIFLAVEKSDPNVAASVIKTVSKTQIGKEPYFGFTRQVVFDKTSPTLGEIRIGSTQGAIIKNNDKLYPIDIINRVEPTADIFASKVIGDARNVKNVLAIQPKQPLLDSQILKISTPQGEGVIAASKIKNIEGGSSKALTAGGFKPIEGQEGTFSFIGGDKPKRALTNDGLVIRTNKNIKGIVQQSKQPTEFIEGGNGLITIQKGKQELNPVTAQMIGESVATQRAKALDIAQSKIVKPETLTGIASPLLVSQEAKQESRNMLSIKQIPSTKTNIKTSTIQLQAIKTSNKFNIAPKQKNIITTLQTKAIPLQNSIQQLIPTQSSKLNQLSRTQLGTRISSRTITQTRNINKYPKIFATNIATPKGRDGIYNRIIGKKSLYQALSKRKGKEISLGEFGTQAEAEYKLKSYLTGTLAASGKIIKDNKELSFGELKSFGRGFNPSKRDFNKIVQTRGFRLGSFGERKEIKGSKRRNRIW